MCGKDPYIWITQEVDMLLFLMIFLKRPHYALGFLPLPFLALMVSLMGNGFVGLFIMFFSSIFWCLCCLSFYISDEQVKTKLFGVDLKTYVPVANNILIGYGCIIMLSWMVLLMGELDYRMISTILGVLFLYTLVAISGGVALMLASLAIKISRTNIKADKPSAQRLFEDIKNLISQP